MKAIYTSRSYKGSNYIGDYPVGDPQDIITFHTFDSFNNRFDIVYTGRQKLPTDLEKYDIDIEVKFTLTPKKEQKIVTEFK